jgi:atypical dual specificity phosphatase
MDVNSSSSVLSGDSFQLLPEAKPPKCKAAQVALRVLKSPLFWSGIQIIGIAVFSAVVWTGSTVISITISLAILGIGVIAFSIHLAIFHKQLLYESSLAGTMAKNAVTQKKWWNKIDEHIFLGAIPLKNKDHIKKLVDECNIGVVITYLEKFETKKGMLSEPVCPEDWKKAGVEHHWVVAKDFKPLSMEQISEGVKLLRESVANAKASKIKDPNAKKNVLVHCKAGVGRSATIVICYYYQDMGYKTFEEAFAAVKKQRPQIKLNKKQKAAALAYCASIQKNY